MNDTMLRLRREQQKLGIAERAAAAGEDEALRKQRVRFAPVVSVIKDLREGGVCFEDRKGAITPLPFPGAEPISYACDLDRRARLELLVDEAPYYQLIVRVTDPAELLKGRDGQLIKEQRYEQVENAITRIIEIAAKYEVVKDA